MAEKQDLFHYNEDSVITLDWREHIRLRPGMYIGKLGDGSSPDDGIYVMIKEVIDNCIDEHTMGYGKQVEITIEKKAVTIRDFGRGEYRVFSAVSNGLHIEVAQSMDVIREAEGGVALATLLPMVLLLPVLALVIGIVIRRQIKPSAGSRSVAGALSLRTSSRRANSQSSSRR